MAKADHAVSRHQAAARLCDLERTRLATQLPDGLDQPDHAAGRARLAAGELSAVGVERERAIEGEGPVGEKPPDLALAAEAVILELDRDHDGIVVVGLDKVHVGWAVARVGPEKIAIQLPAAAQGRDLA